VGAREAAELKSIILDAQIKALALFRETLCGAVPTVWDLRGALILIRWLEPIRPIGNVINHRRRADPQVTLSTWLTSSSCTSRTARRRPSVDHVRLWIQISCLDLM
jgi:hypothetical protein